MKFSNLTPLLVALALAISATGLCAADCDNPSQLRFSLIPQADAKKNAADFAPLLKALEAELGKPVDVVLPNSYGFVVEGLLAASIDIAMLGPATYATVKDSDPGITAFATYASNSGAFQQEGTSFLSLLVVRADSKYLDVDSLKGARLALVDPSSSSGAVVPRYYFSGLLHQPFEKYFGKTVYTGGHDKSAEALLSGQVDAAFISSFLLSDFVRRGKAGKTDFRVLWHSEPLPIDPFVYRGHLCSPIKEAIRNVFLRGNGQAYPSVLRTLNASRIAPVGDDSYKTIRAILSTKPAAM